jgi:hypothetical protein
MMPRAGILTSSGKGATQSRIPLEDPEGLHQISALSPIPAELKLRAGAGDAYR